MGAVKQMLIENEEMRALLKDVFWLISDESLSVDDAEWNERRQEIEDKVREALEI